MVEQINRVKSIVSNFFGLNTLDKPQIALTVVYGINSEK